MGFILKGKKYFYSWLHIRALNIRRGARSLPVYHIEKENKGIIKDMNQHIIGSDLYIPKKLNRETHVPFNHNIYLIKGKVLLSLSSATTEI